MNPVSRRAVLCAAFVVFVSPVAVRAQTIEPEAMALLANVEKTMLGLKTYQADCDSTISPPPKDGKPARERREVATLRAVKPNKMRYDQWNLKRDAATGKWRREPKAFITFACDGKTNWQQFGDTYQTSRRTGPEYLRTISEPWGGFHHVSSSPRNVLMYSQKEKRLLELRRDGSEAVDGVPCDKVFAHYTSDYGAGQTYWTTWYIAKNDGLVRRKTERIEFGDKPGYTRNAVLRNIRVNAPIVASVFTYQPPKGVVAQEKRAAERPKLLAAGTLAPDFSALDKNSKPVKLSDFKGKIVVLDFWASWCPPCVASMPHNQAVAKKLQAEGLPVVLLAVDNSEARAAFSAWVSKRPELDAITFVHAARETANIAGKLYNVSGIPTQYIVDKNGVVRAAFVGFSGPTDDLEKAIRAALVAR